MKLSDYAKKKGVSYVTAYRWFKAGNVKGYQAETGTIIVTEQDVIPKFLKVAVYARVSSSENKSNLDSQADRLTAYCAAKGYQVAKVVKEIGSGVNDNRQKLIDLLSDETITLIVVESYRSICDSSGCFKLIESTMKSAKRRIELLIVEGYDL